MSTPKFTPGPWTVFQSKIEGTWIDPIGLRVDGIPNDKADAALIAAAPDMHHAIQIAAGWLEAPGKGNPKLIAEMLRDVLARAEGTQS